MSNNIENTEKSDDRLQYVMIRRLVWLYFWSLILEGPLRKWILPGFSNPLLLVRDPIALSIYGLCVAQSAIRLNPIILCLIGTGCCCFVTGMLWGTGNVLVTLYGFDASFFHLPMVYVIAHVFDKSDAIKVGKCVLYLLIPMSLLMVWQFRSSPNAFVNFGPGATPGTQMQAVLGRIRPPGIFTFITGAAQFLSFAAAFIVFGSLQKGALNQFLLVGCGVALIISTTVSTSRLVLGGIGLVFLMVGVIALCNRNVVRSVVGMLLPIGLAFFIATNLDVFHESIYVFEARLANTGDSTLGLAGTASSWSGRVLGDFIAGFKALQSAPTFGYGLGFGTNVGARVLTGKFGFLADEREWGRVILEMGPVLGVPYLVCRVAIFVSLCRLGLLSARRGNFLPLLLLGSFGLPVLNGQFGVTSIQGFTIFGAGLCFAANNDTHHSVKTYLPRLLHERIGVSVYSRGLRQPLNE